MASLFSANFRRRWIVETKLKNLAEYQRVFSVKGCRTKGGRRLNLSKGNWKNSLRLAALIAITSTSAELDCLTLKGGSWVVVDGGWWGNSRALSCFVVLFLRDWRRKECLYFIPIPSSFLVLVRCGLSLSHACFHGRIQGCGHGGPST